MHKIQNFKELNLIDSLARAVNDAGYETPTPIQAQSIPYLLKGRDLLGCAQTGTGKTAAFALPVLQGLEKSGGRTRRIRALVMTPTRELAAQIYESFKIYGQHLSMTSAVIFGGVGQGGQESALKRGPEVLVATPGRLLDLMGQKLINLNYLEYFILDEADRMLDMGFIHDVNRVIEALPEKRQSLFFSATMPPAVAKLADRLLTDPVRVSVVPQSTMADRIDQQLMFVDKSKKRKLLELLLKSDETIERALVFSRTKHGADRICRHLTRRKINALAIHGNKSQNARTRAMDAFRSGELRVLVATDIAARGIDVEGITHVINFDLPNESESYIHRVGRTARAGKAGKAIAFCSGDELAYLHDIERLLKQKVPVITDHEFHSEDAAKGFVDGRPAENPAMLKARAREERSRNHQKRYGGVRSKRSNPSRKSDSSSKTGGRPNRFKSDESSSKRRRRPRRAG